MAWGVTKAGGSPGRPCATAAGEHQRPVAIGAPRRSPPESMVAHIWSQIAMNETGPLALGRGEGMGDAGQRSGEIGLVALAVAAHPDVAGQLVTGGWPAQVHPLCVAIAATMSSVTCAARSLSISPASRPAVARP